MWDGICAWRDTMGQRLLLVQKRLPFRHHTKSLFQRQIYLGLVVFVRLRLKCDGKRAETRFRLSVKWRSPFKLVGSSVQSTTGSRGVRISGSNAGYIMFRCCVKSTGYPLHSPVSPSLLHPCVAVCHHISTGLYLPHIHTETDLKTRVPFPSFLPRKSQRNISKIV